MNSNRILKQFEKIYNETYKNTLTYICSKCSNINDIDDILQETYIEVYKQLKKKKKVINYKSYIIFIEKNKINQYFNESQKSKNISIFQDNNEDEEYIINLDSRYRYRIRIHYKR